MKMRKLFLSIVMLILLLNLNIVYAAKTLQVEKIIDKKDIKVGDDVTIFLKIINPFEKQIPIKIIDKNIFGNNGLDIQCLEYTIPDQREATIAYDPIKPFKYGQYILDSAKITYTNPETGKEETISSNKLDISVHSSNVQGQSQGITTIYRCNGVNMQTTSYSSSGSSFNIQIGGSNIQQQSSTQKSVQNNQMNQITGSLKKQMEEQIKQQEQIEKEFQENLVKNQEFQEQHEKLLNSAYNLTNASFNPSTNNTGSFELYYQRPNGEEASIKGRMENGALEDLMVQTAEDRQKILQLLNQDKQFQEYNKQLINQGFNQTQPFFNQISQNYTKITVPYKNENEQKEIRADFINGTIKNVYFEDNEKSDFWWFLLLIPISGIIILIFYKKLLKKLKKITETKKQELKIEKPIDYLKEAKEMLKQAKNLFDEKKEKDAYEKVSQAIRLYFSYELNVRKEMTNSDLLSHLKKIKKNLYLEVKKCLDLCALVEFAKYRPNNKDFKKIIQIAEEIIGG